MAPILDRAIAHRSTARDRCDLTLIAVSFQPEGLPASGPASYVTMGLAARGSAFPGFHRCRVRRTQRRRRHHAHGDSGGPPRCGRLCSPSRDLHAGGLGPGPRNLQAAAKALHYCRDQDQLPEARHWPVPDRALSYRPCRGPSGGGSGRCPRSRRPDSRSPFDVRNLVTRVASWSIPVPVETATSVSRKLAGRDSHPLECRSAASLADRFVLAAAPCRPRVRIVS